MLTLAASRPPVAAHMWAQHEGAAARDAGNVLTFTQDSNLAGVSSKGDIHRLSIDDLVLEVVVLAAAKQSSS